MINTSIISLNSCQLAEGATSRLKARQGKETRQKEQRKIGACIVNNTNLLIIMKNLPSLYQTHLQNYFSGVSYLMVSIVIMLLQKNRWIRLESLAENFPSPILQKSRIKKLQRFLSLPVWDVKIIWFPLFKAWLENEFKPGDILYLVIDRTQWANVNILMISLVYNRRAIPIYFTLLGKLGNTNTLEQKWFLAIVLELLQDYPKVVLGDTTTSG